jgi:molybdate transport system substrate-binding protein
MGVSGRLALVVAVVAALCSATASMAGERVTVFAAASLKNALDAVTESCTAETGIPASISYAASSALARQIEAGAPADIFISADLDWMTYLSDRKLTKPESETRLLGNRIVLIAPADSAAEATIGPGFDLAGLLGGGRLAIGDVRAVPAGKYAMAALQSLGVWQSVGDHTAQAENVRAALKLVATGEAPLGIVYRTDAAAEHGVRIIDTFPESSHPPIVYPAAELAEAREPEASTFFACLGSARARPLYEAGGFTVLAPAAAN